VPRERRRSAIAALVVGGLAVVGIVIGTAIVTPQSVSSVMPDGVVHSNGVTWRPVFSQDFDRDAPTGTVLSRYPDLLSYGSGDDTSGKGTYAPNSVLSVHDSMLDWHLRTVDGRPRVASVLPEGYTGHTYSRVSLRYRADVVPGYKFVMVLWPLSDDWNDGEIDWPEGDLADPPRPASAIPGSFDSSTEQMTFLPKQEAYAPTDQRGWHVATVEWTPDAVRFLWDGEVVSTVHKAVPSVPMRVTLQAETTIDDEKVPAASAGHVQVDWISVFEDSDQSGE